MVIWNMVMAGRVISTGQGQECGSVNLIEQSSGLDEG